MQGALIGIPRIRSLWVVKAAGRGEGLGTVGTLSSTCKCVQTIVGLTLMKSYWET